ncbi:MAG TPA: hypothetical protein VNP98_00215 [Chthoniobacterales bacterium]|nr:hypothetical protein [Chthoniobacterales bacterium]
MFFVNPGVRFSRRFSFFQIQMRSFASRLFRWLTGADAHPFRNYSRRLEAEFPPATQIADQLLFFGSRAADRASIDALRPNYNWVELEDQHDISIIGEKWPAFARRLPQKGRQSPALSGQSGPAAGAENVLADSNGVVHRWKTGGAPAGATGTEQQQRRRAFAFAA